jgi:hypothetical protein
MKKVVLDRGKFNAIGRVYEKTVIDVDVPEFNPVMGLPTIEEMREIENEYRLLQKESDKKSKEKQKRKKELKEKIENFEIVVFKIGQLSLSDYMSIRHDLNDYVRNLLDGITSAATKTSDIVKEEVIDALNSMNAEAKNRLFLVKAGLIEPKLSESELIRVAELFPAVMMRLSSKIIELTEKGATLKKSMKDS